MRRSIVAVVPSVKLDCPHPISSFRCDTPPPHPVLARVVEKRGAASSKFKRSQKAEAAIARYPAIAPGKNRKTVYGWIATGEIGEADGLFIVQGRFLIHWPTFRAKQFKPREKLQGQVPDFSE